MSRRRARLQETNTGSDEPEGPPASLGSSLDDILQRSPWVSRAVILLLAAALQLNTLGAEFTFDDARGVVSNPDLESSSPLANIFLNDFWGTPMTRPESHKSYRPLTVLTFRANAELAGGRVPFPFHLTNVIFHVLVCCLFHEFCLKLFAPRALPAFLAALLFLAHPIHAEAVANTVGRAEVLAAIFYLICLTLYTSWAAQRFAFTLTSTVIKLGTAFMLAAAAMLSKEQGLTVLGICMVVDVCACVVSSVEHAEAKQNGSKVKTERDEGSVIGEWRCWHILAPPSIKGSTGARMLLHHLRFRLIFTALGSFALLFFRLRMLHGQAPIFNPLEMPATFSESFVTRTLTLNYLVTFNAGLLLLPWRLSMDWSHGSIPLVQSIADYRVLLTVALYAGVAVGMWRALRPMFTAWATSFGADVSPADKRKSHLSLLSVEKVRQWMWQTVGLALVVVPFLPGSNLFFIVGYVVAERTLYTPSMGYCILVAGYACKLIFNREGSTATSSTLSPSSKVTSPRTPTSGGYGQSVLALLVVALYIAFLAEKTYIRNSQWHSDYTIHEADSKTNVFNAKLITNFGLLQYEKCKTLPESSPERQELQRRAEEHYKRALDLDSTYPPAAFDYGNLLYDQGRIKESIEMYKRGLLSVDKTRVPLKILNNLATVEYQQGNYAAAELHFQAAIQIDPAHMTAHNGLGALYGSMGKRKESEHHFREALKINPNYAEGHFNLGTLLVQEGSLDEGEESLMEALRLNPNHSGAKNNLEVVYYQRKQAQKKGTPATAREKK